MIKHLSRASTIVVVVVVIVFSLVTPNANPQTDSNPLTIDDTRPALEWWIWYNDADGNKKGELYIEYDPGVALKKFYKLHEGEGFVLRCLNNPHYSTCEDRVW